MSEMRHRTKPLSRQGRCGAVIADDFACEALHPRIRSAALSAHLASLGASYARMNTACTALRFFFHVTLSRTGFGDRMARIPMPDRWRMRGA
jgi:hypothetical protein